MMPLLLAQADASTPTFEQIGMVIVVLMLLARWMWDRDQAKRAERDEHEPRSNPPLHQAYVTRREFDNHVTEMGRRLDKIEEAGEQRVLRIYDKIDTQTERIIESLRK